MITSDHITNGHLWSEATGHLWSQVPKNESLWDVSHGILQAKSQHFLPFSLLSDLLEGSSNLHSLLYVSPLHFSPSYTHRRSGLSELLHVLKGRALDRQVSPSTTYFALCQFQLCNINFLSFFSKDHFIFCRLLLSRRQNHVGTNVESALLHLLSYFCSVHPKALNLKIN